MKGRWGCTYVRMLSCAIYGRVLYLYPRSLRREFGPDMTQVCGDLSADAWSEHGASGLIRCWLTLLLDLAISLPREHWRARGVAPRHLTAPDIAAATGRAEVRPVNAEGRSNWPQRVASVGWLRPLRELLSGRRLRGYALTRELPDPYALTRRAARVLELAQDEARVLGHGYIGTEHLLLGLLDEDEGLAARTLSACGVSAEPVREEVLHLIGRKSEQPVGAIALTPRSKRALQLAHVEAVALGHRFVGTEHILLGLVREGNGIGADVLECALKQRSETLPMLRQAILRALQCDGNDDNDDDDTAASEPGSHER